ncbi:MAG: type I-D CRISPR-associated protein Cas5/Csc1 [Candidatus Altiarchaeales archaeon]|nr:type I-D CRISPR-associated protein Cas5/Csc1 [Candidatus Altiarchaeales archaeon]
MHIYRCWLTLMEKTFFSSREISNFYYTEPLIGNYALAYAMGFCQAPYSNDGTIHYRQHLEGLNRQGVYITPGTVQGQPRFFIEQFNAQPETYWSAMGAGVLVTRPDGSRMEQSGKVWYVYPRDGRRQKVNATNRPQFGRIRYLAVGNEAVCYVFCREPTQLPSYIRLGKFMSKVRVQSQELTYEEREDQGVSVPLLLNPADLGPKSRMSVYDLVTVPPTPLVRNAVLSGPFYRLSDETTLPAGMRFGVEELPV